MSLPVGKTHPEDSIIKQETGEKTGNFQVGFLSHHNTNVCSLSTCAKKSQNSLI